MIKATEVMGQPAMWLQAPDGAEATVLLHGGQLVSWIPAGDQERLYLSPQARFGDSQAVRGGIPVIFPQFAAQGVGPRHGLLRSRAWQWVEGVQRAGAAIGVLRIASDAATQALWPHPFEAELTLVLSGLELDIELAITNTGSAPFNFTAALHTYLRVDDVRRARLGGLYGVRYTDKVHGGEHRQEIDPFSFVGEIDRVYFDVDTQAQPLSLATAMGRMTILAEEGFHDVVVWNPGPDKARVLADLPDHDWPHFLCVEAGAIGRPVVLVPGQEWVGRQRFAA